MSNDRLEHAGQGLHTERNKGDELVLYWQTLEIRQIEKRASSLLCFSRALQVLTPTWCHCHIRIHILKGAVTRYCWMSEFEVECWRPWERLRWAASRCVREEAGGQDRSFPWRGSCAGSSYRQPWVTRSEVVYIYNDLHSVINVIYLNIGDSIYNLPPRITLVAR